MAAAGLARIFLSSGGGIRQRNQYSPLTGLPTRLPVNSERVPAMDPWLAQMRLPRFPG